MLTSGRFERFKKFVGGGEKRPSVDLKEVKRLVFPHAEPPVLVSEDAGLFSHIMSFFQNYEKTVSQCPRAISPLWEPSSVICVLPQLRPSQREAVVM